MSEEVNWITVPLGFTSTLPLRYDDPFKQQLLSTFKSNVRITIGRLSKECISIKIEHLDVTSARYETFSYTDEVVGLIGDTLHLQYQRYVRISSFTFGKVTLEFGKL